MSTKFPKEQILSAYNQAPDPVRHVFNGDDTVEIIVSIQNTYGLHIDTAGMLGQEIGYLLLGLTSPREFSDRLHANGLPTDTVTSIVKDVNEKIFVPLQRKMRVEGSGLSTEPTDSPMQTPPEVQTAAAPQTESVPVMQVGAPVAQVVPQAPAVPTPPAPGASSQEWSSGVVPSAPPIVQSAPLPSIPTYEEVSVQPVVPKFRTMASDMQSLAGTPPKNQSMPPSQSMPQQTSPARSFQTSSVPATNTPPILPGQEASPVSAVFSSTPQTPLPEIPSFRYSEPSVKHSTSSLDPYREPTD